MYKVYALPVVIACHVLSLSVIVCQAVQLGPVKDGIQLIGVAGKCQVTHYNTTDGDWTLVYKTNNTTRIFFTDGVPDLSSTFLVADLGDYVSTNGFYVRFYSGGWQHGSITNWAYGSGYCDALLYSGSTLAKHYRFPAAWRYQTNGLFIATNRFIKPVSSNTQDTVVWSAELGSWIYVPRGVLPDEQGNGAWEVRPSGDFNWNMNLGGQEGAWYAPEIDFTNNPNASLADTVSSGMTFAQNSNGTWSAGYGRNADGTIEDVRYETDSNGVFQVSSSATNTQAPMSLSEFYLNGIYESMIQQNEILLADSSLSSNAPAVSVSSTNHVYVVVTNSFDGLTLWFEQNLQNTNIVANITTNPVQGIPDMPDEGALTNIVLKAVGMSSNIQSIATILTSMTSTVYNAHGEYSATPSVQLDLPLIHGQDATPLIINPVAQFGAEKCNTIKSIISAFCYFMLLVSILKQLNTGLKP